MIKDWERHLTEKRAEQCLVGTKFIIGLVQNLRPVVYVETGCAHLATFELYHSMLPTRGYALGIDIKRYPPWSTYHITSTEKDYCEFNLVKGSTASTDGPSVIRSRLRERSIDFLFIDGDHSIEGVEADWNCLGPLVRSGGLVVLHDYDPSALKRGDTSGQGAAGLCLKLKQQNYTIYSVPQTAVGTAYFYKP